MTEIPYLENHPILGMIALVLNVGAKICVVVLVGLTLLAFIKFLLSRERYNLEAAGAFLVMAGLCLVLGGWVLVGVIAFGIMCVVAYLAKEMDGTPGVPDSPAYHQDHWGSPF